MIRSPFKFALILVAVLMIVCIGAKAVGALQPIHPAMEGFIEGCDGKPKPCWYGIVPGVTSKQAAMVHLDERHYNSHPRMVGPRPGMCDLHIAFGLDRAKTNGWIMLYNCTTLQLGDVNLVLGTPDSVAYRGTTKTAILRYGRIFVETRDTLGLSPDSPVLTIMVWNDGVIFNGDVIITPSAWHGYLRRFDYCQFEPGYQPCRRRQ